MIRRNLVANFLGQGWTALLGLAFIPVYIKYLGIEAYGLIGLFAVLQAWLTVCDFGLCPTLGREMTRRCADPDSGVCLRNLLRTVEIIIFIIAITVALFTAATSQSIAYYWFTVESLGNTEVAHSLALMGLAASIRFAENIYKSSLFGLQRQVVYNTINAITTTVRTFGAVLVLIYVESTIVAFFWWQVLASLVSLTLMAVGTYLALPKREQKGRFSFQSLAGLRSFSLGIMGITFLSMLLTQADKLVLSKVVSLEEFAVYSVAASVASALILVVTPIGQAFYPRLCQLVRDDNKECLNRVFHNASQLVSIAAGCTGIIAIVFAEKILTVWSSNPNLAKDAAPIVQVLLSGYLLNSVMTIPHQTQMAYGWTSLSVCLNSIAVSVLIPTLLIIAPHYGGIGVAYLWLSLNLVYVIVGANLMFGKILTTERMAWYIRDLLLPLTPIAVVALLFECFWPVKATTGETLALLSLAALLSVLISSVASSHVRNEILRLLVTQREPIRKSEC